MGDININILPECIDVYANRYEDIMSNWGMQKLINKVTREECRAGIWTKACIDHIFYRGPKDKPTAAVLRNKISDHYCVIAAIDYKIKLPEKNIEVFKIIDRKKYIHEFNHLLNVKKEKIIENNENIYENIKNIIICSKKNATHEKI